MSHEFVERIAALDPSLGPMDITQLVLDARRVVLSEDSDWDTFHSEVTRIAKWLRTLEAHRSADLGLAGSTAAREAAAREIETCRLVASRLEAALVAVDMGLVKA